MIKVNSDRCTGCAACMNICPNNSIQMHFDDEGFIYPKVNKNNCINCNQCEKVCPIDKNIADRNHHYHTLAYAGHVQNIELRLQSATGGIAYICGKYIIECGGIVFGVIGNVLDKVYHAKAETIEELSLMRGSKYLQSNTGYIYRQVKKALDSKRKVLFTGTPCQIAGLYGYMGNIPPNLFTLDLVCHGVPSTMVFKKYINELQQQTGKQILSFYRDKSKGWKPTWFSYIYEDETKISKRGKENLFNYAFTTNLITRKSCQHCDYAQIPRVADLSVGDYINDKKAFLHDRQNTGLSIVTINSEKGYDLFSNIKRFIICYEYPVDEVTRESEHLAKSPRANIFRRSFFYLLKKRSFFTTADIMLPKNTFHRNIRRFYGIFCYIYEFLKKL